MSDVFDVESWLAPLKPLKVPVSVGRYIIEILANIYSMPSHNDDVIQGIPFRIHVVPLLNWLVGKAPLQYFLTAAGFTSNDRHCNALTRPSKNALPSVPPNSGSVAFSGCGIRPRMVRLSLKMPAMARAEPLKLSRSVSAPDGPQ